MAGVWQPNVNTGLVNHTVVVFTTPRPPLGDLCPHPLETFRLRSVFKKKPGYPAILNTPTGKDSGRLTVDDGLLRFTGSKTMGFGRDTELPVDQITAISTSRDAYYRVTLRVGVDAFQFLMTPGDGKSLIEEIRQAQAT